MNLQVQFIRGFYNTCYNFFGVSLYLELISIYRWWNLSRNVRRLKNINMSKTHNIQNYIILASHLITIRAIQILCTIFRFGKDWATKYIYRKTCNWPYLLYLFHYSFRKINNKLKLNISKDRPVDHLARGIR